jgi:SsrA-binding protein
MYIVRGRAKLLIALGRGKKLYDKRKDIQEKDVKRDLEKALRR